MSRCECFFNPETGKIAVLCENCSRLPRVKSLQRATKKNHRDAQRLRAQLPVDPKRGARSCRR